MSTGELTLYSDAFWISPYVFTCFVALREKGATFAVKELKLQEKQQRDGGYRARSVTGRVPALVHGDFWLTESSAILEYIEESFPAPTHASLFPEGREARARARQILSWLRSDETLVVREERSAEVIFYDLARPPLEARAMERAEEVVALVERFRKEAGATGDGPTFGAWTIVDAELAFFLHRLWEDGALVPDGLRAYAYAQWKRPSVAEYVGHARAPFIKYT